MHRLLWVVLIVPWALISGCSSKSEEVEATFVKIQVLKVAVSSSGLSDNAPVSEVVTIMMTEKEFVRFCDEFRQQGGEFDSKIKGAKDKIGK